MTKRLKSNELEMTDDVYGAMMISAPVRYRIIIWALVAMVAAFVTWAAMSSLDQVTRGDGKVIPSSQVQVIQSLDGGILQAMYIKEGMIVTEGQPLARIDDTRFRSDVAQQEEEGSSLEANILRMQQELASIELAPVSENWREQIRVKKADLVFPSEMIAEEPELVSRQRLEYEGRLDDLSNKLEIQRAKYCKSSRKPRN